MNTTKTKGAGRGRTKGSYSFVTLTLQELSAKLNGDANVVISRKWAENIGLATGLTATNSLSTFAKATPTTPEAPKLQLTVTE